MPIGTFSFSLISLAKLVTGDVLTPVLKKRPSPAEIQADKKSVVITTEEDLAGVIAVDCMYGKRFTPTLVDEKTNESVLSFYNVIAEYENKIPVTESLFDAVTFRLAPFLTVNSFVKSPKGIL